ncbi:hypothetical protein CPB83DRAFT_757128 [Crepidotus variabilis]|uniref:Uncharacterized protein n=1 Tax=Crepidotus variabilis TaxID=179855 RepID=A0A9P6ERD6_9AGAR|nr:hypothetical protein CPB83DRAFT_757128 [Crepidotus variabilis]
MIVHIENPYEGKKVEEIARQMIGERVFMGWPFLQEGQVVAISDSLFKYEKMSVTPTSPSKVVPTPHAPQALGYWKMKAERIETYYSKRCGVITGNVDVLLHVRPLKGLKRLESGAFVKDYEGPDQETEQAVQMCLSEVVSEDPRYMEREAPPLSEDFPDGSKVFFLGEHAYGVAAQVASTAETTLSVILAFYPSEKSEMDEFKSLVQNRKSSRYYPSYKAAELVGLSGRALGKILSSFMVITSDGQKTNLGLSLKFEAKALKVIDYSRKDGRTWDYSQKALDLIKEYKVAFPDLFRMLEHSGDAMIKATELFTGSDPDGRVKDVKAWLKQKGVRDFEPVSLFCDQLGKDTVAEIESLADTFTKNKSSTQIKKAIVKGIPRQAVLKPAHAAYRLHNQHFGLGDRVTMIQDSGGVPLSVKGVVIGLNTKSMDVVWDVPFMSGGTLGDRCSQYRGSSVEFGTCLNLTNPQFVTSTNPQAPPPVRNHIPFNPRFGPYPAVQPSAGQRPAAGFRPAPKPANNSNAVHIMMNPNRGRGQVQNRGGSHHSANGNPQLASIATPNNDGANPPQTHPAASRGYPRGRGGHAPPFRGRGFAPNVSDRGRGSPRGAFRGRGRGSFAAPLPS